MPVFPRQTLRTVLLAAACVHAAMFFVFLVRGPATFLRSNDSALYLTAVHNLQQYGIFSEHAASPPPASMLHLPGYPLFLLATTTVTSAPWFTAWLQNIISLATVALVFLLISEHFNRPIAFWGALLYGIEPFTAYQANLVMSDTLFVFLLTAGLFCFLRAWQTSALWWLVGAAVIFSLATYVRSLSLYAVVLLTLWWFCSVWRRRRTWRLAVAGVGFLALVALALAPWVVRNGRTFGLWKISSQPNYMLMLYHANQAISLRDGISPQEARGRLIAEMEAQAYDVSSRDQFMGRRARQILREEWRAYVPVYALKTVPFFLQSGWRDVAQAVGFASLQRPVDLTGAMLRGQWRTVLQTFRGIDVPQFLHVLGALAWLAISGLALWSPFVARRTDIGRRPIIALLLSLVVLFALLASPLAHARYRLPVAPWMFALAVYAVIGRRKPEAKGGEPASQSVEADSSAPAQNGADRSQRDGEI